MRKLKIAMLIVVTMVCTMSFIGCGLDDKKDEAKARPSVSATVETEQPTASVEPLPSVSASTEQTKTEKNDKKTSNADTKTKAKVSQSNTTTKKQTKDNTSESGSIVPGTYLSTWTRDVKGKKATVEDYLILNKDGTGYKVVIDTAVSPYAVKIKWDKSAIYDTVHYENYPYKYKASSKTISVTEGDAVFDYVFASTSIPATAKEYIEKIK